MVRTEFQQPVIGLRPVEDSVEIGKQRGVSDGDEVGSGRFHKLIIPQSNIPLMVRSFFGQYTEIPAISSGRFQAFCGDSVIK